MLKTYTHTNVGFFIFCFYIFLIMLASIIFLIFAHFLFCISIGMEYVHKPKIQRLCQFGNGLHKLCTFQSADRCPFWKFIDWVGQSANESESQSWNIYISIYIKQRCLCVSLSVCVSVCLSMHQLSMVDLRAKPMAYLESAGSC